MIAVAAVAGAYLLGAFGSANSRPWLFKGAYATYSGQASIFGTSANFTLSYKVLDYNSTHVHLQLNTSVGAGSFGTRNNSTTLWAKLNSTTTGFSPNLGNYTARTYNATRTVEGKTVDCTAYEFTSGSSTVTVYNSKSADFPVEITFSGSSLFPGGSTITYDLRLVSSNIPGL